MDDNPNTHDNKVQELKHGFAKLMLATMAGFVAQQGTAHLYTKYVVNRGDSNQAVQE